LLGTFQFLLMLAPLLCIYRECRFGEGQNEPGGIKESHVEIRYDPTLLGPTNTRHGSTSLFEVLVIELKVKVIADIGIGELTRGIFGGTNAPSWIPQPAIEFRGRQKLASACPDVM
jgi:hypothetical protein